MAGIGSFHSSLETKLKMHEAVFKRDFVKIEELLSEYDMQYFDIADSNGNTPLLLAAKLGFPEIVVLLLQKGSNIAELSDDRFTLLDEVILSCRDASILREMYTIMQREVWTNWQSTIEPSIRKSMASLPDFYMEIHLKLEGNFFMNALVSYFTPSETYKIWKKGTQMRLDFSIKGFTDSMVAKRGNMSLILTPSLQSDPSSPFLLLKIDRDKITKKDLLQKLYNPSESDFQKFVDKILNSSKEKTNVESVKVNADNDNAEFSMAKDFWGYARKDKLFGKWDCNVWNASMKVKAKMYSKSSNPETTMSYSEYFTPSYGIKLRKVASGTAERESAVDDIDDLVFDGVEDSEAAYTVSSFNACIKEKKVMDRKVVSTIWLSDDVPMSFSDFASILEIINLQDDRMSNFRNLLKKSEEMLTHGCPVKVSVPLLLGVSASVALTAFEVRSDIDDAVFDVFATAEEDRSSVVELQSR